MLVVVGSAETQMQVADGHMQVGSNCHALLTCARGSPAAKPRVLGARYAWLGPARLRGANQKPANRWLEWNCLAWADANQRGWAPDAPHLHSNPGKQGPTFPIQASIPASPESCQGSMLCAGRVIMIDSRVAVGFRMFHSPKNTMLTKSARRIRTRGGCYKFRQSNIQDEYRTSDKQPSKLTET